MRGGWIPTAVAAAALISGCGGLQPLYAGGARGDVAQMLAGVEVAHIEGRAGWLVRTALQARLAIVPNSEDTRYRLVVRLDDSITAIGVLLDDSVTREQRRLRTRYQLVDIDKGLVVLDASAVADIGINAVGSEYATIAAEKTALERLSQNIAEQIIARLALYATQKHTVPRGVSSNHNTPNHNTGEKSTEVVTHYADTKVEALPQP